MGVSEDIEVVSLQTDISLYLSVVFQLSLVEREINEVIRGCYMNSSNKTKTQANITPDSREKLQPREISTEDVCPICQEELLQKSEPLTFCK